MSRVFLNFFIISFFVSSHLTNAENEVQWEAVFNEVWTVVKMAEPEIFGLTILNINKSELIQSNAEIRVVSSNNNIFEVIETNPLDEITEGDEWLGTFTVVPKYLGDAYVFVEIIQGKHKEKSSKSMRITIERKRIVIYPKILNYLSAPYFLLIYYAVLYGTFGMALSVKNVKDAFRKPIGIGLDFLLCFLILPAVSCDFFSSLSKRFSINLLKSLMFLTICWQKKSTFVLSSILYREDDDLDIQCQIHLIHRGFLSMCKLIVANSWVAIVRGNRDLSISITFINIFLSCGRFEA